MAGVTQPGVAGEVAGGVAGEVASEVAARTAAAAAAACLKAGKKSSTCWVATPGHPPRLVWASWLTEAICLVTGGGEQEVPGLAETTSVEVTLPAVGGGIVTVHAVPSAITAADPMWALVARPLAERRLNGAGTPAELLERWAAEANLVRLIVTAG